MKTTAKYQDTGNAGVAALEATQNIVCTVIPGAQQASMGKAVKTVISSCMDVGKARLERKSLGTAIAVGPVNLPTAAGGEAMKKGLQTVLSRAAVPVVDKVLEDQTKKAAQSRLKNRETSSPAIHGLSKSAAGGAGFSAQVSIEEDSLLKLAIVDLAKGIGRSWW